MPVPTFIAMLYLTTPFKSLSLREISLMLRGHAPSDIQEIILFLVSKNLMKFEEVDGVRYYSSTDDGRLFFNVCRAVDSFISEIETAHAN